jgi:hypothetical protein
MDGAITHVKQRVAFGKPLADFQLTQARIADMATAIDSAALLVYRAAWTRDRGAARITREAAALRARGALLSGTSEVLGALALVLALALVAAGAVGGIDRGGLVPFAVVFFMAYRPLRDFVLVQPPVAVEPSRRVRDELAVVLEPLRIAAHPLEQMDEDFAGFRVEPLSGPHPHCCGFANLSGIRLPEIFKSPLWG